MTEILSALLAPLLVIGAIAAVVVTQRQNVRRRRGAVAPMLPLDLRVPRVNADLCIGCEKCVAVCPTSVLNLVHHKSVVAREGDCISCQKCAAVCPTQALVMYEGGVKPTRSLSLPNLDENYQSREVPGLYLIGEAAGKPLVKNGVNLGRAAVEHLRLKSGLVPLGPAPLSWAPGDVEVDVVIVGAGPAGLSAGMTCLLHGLSYVVIERTDSAMSTVMRYPKSKSVHAEPRDVRCVGLLPVWDCKTLELRAEWNRIIDGLKLNVVLETSVEDVQRDGETGRFLVRTKDMSTNGPGPNYRAQRVIVAIGGLGVPRKLGGKTDLPGENLSHVHKALDDAQKYQKQTVLVVGGGDSAVESAVDLARAPLANHVLLSYYKKESCLSCNRKNLALLKQAVSEDRILPLYESSVVSFSRGKVRLALAQSQKREKDIPADLAFVFIGGEPPQKWLDQIHVHSAQFEHSAFRRPPTDQLVEALVGRQPDNDRPGRPLPGVLAGALPNLSSVDLQTLLQAPPDMSVTLIGSPMLVSGRITQVLVAPLAPGQPTQATLIKVARDNQRFRLPERAQIEGPTQTIAQTIGQTTQRPHR